MKNRIKEIREKKNFTQKHIVENLNVSRQYISLLEKTEDIAPSLKVAHGIASALGTCIYNVFDIDGTERYSCGECDCCSSI